MLRGDAFRTVVSSNSCYESEDGNNWVIGNRNRNMQYPELKKKPEVPRAKPKMVRTDSPSSNFNHDFMAQRMPYAHTRSPDALNPTDFRHQRYQGSNSHDSELDSMNFGHQKYKREESTSSSLEAGFDLIPQHYEEKDEEDESYDIDETITIHVHKHYHGSDEYNESLEVTVSLDSENDDYHTCALQPREQKEDRTILSESTESRMRMRESKEIRAFFHESKENRSRTLKSKKHRKLHVEDASSIDVASSFSTIEENKTIKKECPLCGGSDGHITEKDLETWAIGKNGYKNSTGLPGIDLMAEYFDLMEDMKKVEETKQSLLQKETDKPVPPPLPRGWRMSENPTWRISEN